MPDRNPKIPTNAPKLDKSVTDKTTDEIQEDIENGLEEIDEKTRREQQHFPSRNLPSNAPKFEEANDEAEELQQKK